MATTTNYPTTDTAVSGTWVNPTNVQADDGAVAAITRGTTKNSQDDREQAGYGFDSSIPVGATIDQVDIEVEHRVQTTSNVCFLENLAYANGVEGAVNSDSLEPIVLTARAYTSYARPGGGGWTRNDLLNANFKTRIRARNGNNATSNTWEWDYIRVKVTYTTEVTTDKTITAIARITAITDKTITTLARITATTDKTIATLARITATTDKTITAIANISPVGTTQTITAIARITVTTDKTIGAIGDILKTTDRTTTAIARITSIVDKTIASQARITATTDKTITAIANIYAITYTSYGPPFLYTSANWGAVSIYLEVYMRATTGTAWARLYNVTDLGPVTDSVLSTTETTMQRLRTTSALTLTNNKIYRLQFGKSGSDAGEFLGGELVII